MGGPTFDIGFGFNNASFSDRVIRIEISTGDCLIPIKNEYADVEVKTIQISSVILAASSPFFYKLFQNGMRESQQREVTLRINAYEEAALMDILKFIYSNTLSATTLPDLLGVLMVADKLEVTSCVRYCSLELQKMMSVESALLYLDLPTSVLQSEAIQPLIVAAKKFLAECFTESKEELMDLPLWALEGILGSDDLKVYDEGDVFDFILEWASARYLKPEERREILTKSLMGVIRFPHMSSSKLKKILVCPDFDHEQVSKIVLEALFLKSRTNTNCTCLGRCRVYKLRPIKVVEFDFSQPRCVVYFDLTKEECENLSESTPLWSQAFRLGGRWFSLSAQRRTNEQQHSSFGLFLHMEESKSCTLKLEFAAIKRSTKEFGYKRKGEFNHTTSTSELRCGYNNLFKIPWTDFMSSDNEYFIDEILHIRADVTIYDSQP